MHAPEPPLALPPGMQSTLLDTLDVIVNHRIHRLYVVDADQRPIGVITCTDVLRVLLREADAQQVTRAVSAAAASAASNGGDEPTPMES